MMLRAALAAAALAAGWPAAASAAGDLKSELKALAALDARVQSAGWRLVRSNAPFCGTVAPGIGLQLFDAAGFDDPPQVREALGVEGDIAVQAVAAEGPAARAGLTAHAALRSVAGQDVAALPHVEPGDYARLAGLHDRVDAALAEAGSVTFAVADGAPLSVSGEPACVTRFEMLSKGARAAADGKRVVIGRKLVEGLPDELLAAALAHELAHNLLGHRARLDASGRSWGKVKQTEREADRLMPWLLANAGYDPRAAVRFFEAWGPKHDLGILSTPDHDRWKTRARKVAAEIELVRAAQSRRGGAADWKRDFRPQG
ncbi:MAG: M48 family metalloprotease [Novosphingobium sp.]|nr:M48 family metalloprotease [Novosphingobium sp.]